MPEELHKEMFIAPLFIKSKKLEMVQLSIVNSTFHIKLKNHAKLNNVCSKDAHVKKVFKKAIVR